MRIALVIMAIIFAMAVVTGFIGIYAVKGKSQNISDKLARAIGEIQGDLKNLQGVAAILTETDARLEKDNGGFRGELAKIPALEAAGAGNKQEIEKCQSELDDLLKKIAALEALNTELANQIEQKIKSVSDAQNNIKKSVADSQDKIQKDFISAQIKTRKEINDAQAQNQKDISEVRTQITSLNESLAKVNEKLDDIKKTLSKLPGLK